MRPVLCNDRQTLLLRRPQRGQTDCTTLPGNVPERRGGLLQPVAILDATNNVQSTLHPCLERACCRQQEGHTPAAKTHLASPSSTTSPFSSIMPAPPSTRIRNSTDRIHQGSRVASAMRNESENRQGGCSVSAISADARPLLLN